MNEVVEAIVLKQTQYRESDVLINVLTEKYGRLTLVGRGVKKMTSKNAVSCTPFVVSKFIFDWKDGKSMYTLKNGSLVDSFRYVRESLEKVHIAQLFSELIEIVIPQGEEDEVSLATFHYLKFCLSKLNECEDQYYLPLAFFLAKFLEVQGLSPVIDSCVGCGSLTIDGIHLESGGFICKKCAISESEIVIKDAGVLKRFRWINKAKMVNYDILATECEWGIEDCELLMDFLQTHTGINSKSWSFLKGILKK